MPLHPAPRSRRPLPPAALAVAAFLLAVLGATALLSPAAHATTNGADDAHPAELQPGPEDGQPQFGEPADERTEQVTRLLRNVLGGIVAVVILLLVIVLPLKLRNDTPDRDPDTTSEDDR